MAEMTLREFNKVAHSYGLHLFKPSPSGTWYMWSGMNPVMRRFINHPSRVAHASHPNIVDGPWDDWHDLYWINELNQVVKAFERQWGNTDYQQLPEQLDLAVFNEDMNHVDSKTFLPAFTFARMGMGGKEAFDTLAKKLEAMVKLSDLPWRMYKTIVQVAPNAVESFEEYTRSPYHD
jgi:hypothetical protein